MLAPALMLSACAAQKASAPSAEVEGLRAELQRMRVRTDALENRLEQIENREALRTAGDATRSRSASAEADPTPLAELPSLTVVKLKPSTRPAPPLDTSTPVMEPDPEVLDALDAPDAPREDTGPSSGLAQLAQSQYDAGLESLRTGNLEGGVKQLSEFALNHPEHTLADNALYFAGIGEIGLEEYEQAADHFASVIARYPAGDSVAEAMLKLADCRVHLHQRDDARSLFARVASTYPGTAAATQAQQRLASLSP
jgi:tol-pal system protein YbgF